MTRAEAIAQIALNMPVRAGGVPESADILQAIGRAYDEGRRYVLCELTARIPAPSRVPILPPA